MSGCLSLSLSYHDTSDHTSVSWEENKMNICSAGMRFGMQSLNRIQKELHKEVKSI